MPRKARGPRLYLDRNRKTWVIRDGHRFIRTGWSESSRVDAEKSLQEYLGKKHKPEPGANPLIDDVLTAYGSEHGPHTSRPAEVGYQIASLLRYWSGKHVDKITAGSCRGYAANRPNTAARRDLETLRAAVRYWHREYGPLRVLPAIVLPPKPEGRDRWLTRNEAARLLWAARRTEHLKRFILIGLYTGTRSGAILNLKWEWIDLERGIMRRKETGESETRKRRPPVRLGDRLLSHLRRWHRLRQGATPFVVHYNGRPIAKMRRSWRAAQKRAGLDDTVTPHVLRHTRATWMMQAGISIWQAAGSLGMSVETLQRVYGHHHADWQKEASEV